MVAEASRKESMALSKNLTDLQEMDRYFCMTQFLHHASLDPLSLYSAMGRILSNVTRARAAARIEKIQIDRPLPPRRPRTLHFRSVDHKPPPVEVRESENRHGPKKSPIPAKKRRLADIAADLHAKKAKEGCEKRNESILRVLQAKPISPTTHAVPPTLSPQVYSALMPQLSPGIAIVTEDNRKIKIGRPPKNSFPCGSDSNGNFSRHNDMVYYPNIQCLLCEEWVCSRNRYMHIESHLQYKPYKCSICGYDNRKEIFITLHLRRVHGGKGEVLYHPDAELEKKAWTIAEECLQHTRQLLISQNSEGQSVSPTEKLAEYTDVYRAKISNSQRAEKTQLIEESRQMGILPEFRTGIERETKCGICSAFIIRSPTVTEEHVRSHLPVASYACIVPGCDTAHSSRLFMLRHMKEVHKLRKSPDDLMTSNRLLLTQYLSLCQACFPDFFTRDALERIEMKYASDLLESSLQQPSDRLMQTRIPNMFNQNCLSCQLGLTLSPGGACINCQVKKIGPHLKIRCLQCSMEINDDVTTLLRHSISHLRPLPFSCSHCSFSHWSCLEVERHNAQSHTTVSSQVNLNYQRAELLKRWLDMAKSCLGTDFIGKFVQK